ncbi:MAG TPA: ATP-dependent helicase, partial [Thermoplasmata archaeon]|nr:ATP-dependent helicase [Thermoplasmata archaeon]
MAAFLAGPHEAVVVRVPTPKERSIVVHLVEPDEEDRRLSVRLSCSPDLAGAIRRLLDIVDGARSTLIFVNTREAAEGMASRIAMLGRDDIGVHHGSLSKEIREEMEDAFKKGDLRALIATSSLELGIDIGAIDMVVQYNSPRQVGRLVQRIGRSGHGIGRTSRGVIICTSIDEALESAVIARRAGLDLTEPVTIRRNPLAVLANQIAAMTMEHHWLLDDAFALAREAYPFRDLPRDRFDEVVSMLEATGLVVVSDGTLRGRRSRTYFYENISMIPDSRHFLIRDASSRRGIGVLDEQFVVNHLREGATFIMRGASWRVEEMGDEDILVTRIRDVA